MTGKYEFSTSMTCCSIVLLPTCARVSQSRSDIEAKTGRRTGKRDSAHRDGPSSEICDAGESIEPGSCILRDEVVLLRECPRHVTRSVTRLHLREVAREDQSANRRVVGSSRESSATHHHADVLHRSDGADKGPHPQLQAISRISVSSAGPGIKTR